MVWRLQVTGEMAFRTTTFFVLFALTAWSESSDPKALEREVFQSVLQQASGSGPEATGRLATALQWIRNYRELESEVGAVKSLPPAGNGARDNEFIAEQQRQNAAMLQGLKSDPSTARKSLMQALNEFQRNAVEARKSGDTLSSGSQDILDLMDSAAGSAGKAFKHTSGAGVPTFSAKLLRMGLRDIEGLNRQLSAQDRLFAVNRLQSDLAGELYDALIADPYLKEVFAPVLGSQDSKIVVGDDIPTMLGLQKDATLKALETIKKEIGKNPSDPHLQNLQDLLKLEVATNENLAKQFATHGNLNLPAADRVKLRDSASAALLEKARFDLKPIPYPTMTRDEAARRAKLYDFATDKSISGAAAVFQIMGDPETAHRALGGLNALRDFHRDLGAADQLMSFDPKAGALAMTGAGLTFLGAMQAMLSSGGNGHAETLKRLTELRDMVVENQRRTELRLGIIDQTTRATYEAVIRGFDLVLANQETANAGIANLQESMKSMAEKLDAQKLFWTTRTEGLEKDEFENMRDKCIEHKTLFVNGLSDETFEECVRYFSFCKWAKPNTPEQAISEEVFRKTLEEGRGSIVSALGSVALQYGFAEGFDQRTPIPGRWKECVDSYLAMFSKYGEQFDRLVRHRPAGGQSHTDRLIAQGDAIRAFREAIRTHQTGGVRVANKEAFENLYQTYVSGISKTQNKLSELRGSAEQKLANGFDTSLSPYQPLPLDSNGKSKIDLGTIEYCPFIKTLVPKFEMDPLGLAIPPGMENWIPPAVLNAQANGLGKVRICVLDFRNLYDPNTVTPDFWFGRGELTIVGEFVEPATKDKPERVIGHLFRKSFEYTDSAHIKAVHQEHVDSGRKMSLEERTRKLWNGGAAEAFMKNSYDRDRHPNAQTQRDYDTLEIFMERNQSSNEGSANLHTRLHLWHYFKNNPLMAELSLPDARKLYDRVQSNSAHVDQTLLHEMTVGQLRPQLEAEKTDLLRLQGFLLSGFGERAQSHPILRQLFSSQNGLSNPSTLPRMFQRSDYLTRAQTDTTVLDGSLNRVHTLEPNVSADESNRLLELLYDSSLEKEAKATADALMSSETRKLESEIAQEKARLDAIAANAPAQVVPAPNAMHLLAEKMSGLKFPAGATTQTPPPARSYEKLISLEKALAALKAETDWRALLGARVMQLEESAAVKRLKVYALATFNDPDFARRSGLKKETIERAANELADTSQTVSEESLLVLKLAALHRAVFNDLLGTLSDEGVDAQASGSILWLKKLQEAETNPVYPNSTGEAVRHRRDNGTHAAPK